MDRHTLKELIEHQLVLERATSLGIAKPPYSPGVYALFYDEQRVYIGVARGKKGLRNRKRNYVGGDEGHTTHRQFLRKLPSKADRTAYIKSNVSMAWYETECADIAVELEDRLIDELQPPWNRVGIRK